MCTSIRTDVYFPKAVYWNLNSLLWTVQPFTDEEFHLGNLTSELIELRSDLIQKAEFRTGMGNLQPAGQMRLA